MAKQKSKKATLEDINYSIENLAVAVKVGFDEVDKRFNEVDKRFDEVDKRFEKTDQQLFEIDSKAERIDHRLKEVEKALAPLVFSYGIFQKEIKNLNFRIEKLERKASFAK